MQLSTKAMNLAWALFRSAKTTFSSFAEALICAWRTVKAKAALRKGTVRLTFAKASGEITTRPASMWHGEVSGTGSSNSLTLLFSDHSKAGATSSCRIDRLVSFTTINA